MPRFSSKDYVPPVDSAANIETRDVIGNKSDTHSGDSLVALAHTNEEHNHAVSKVYPTLAAGVTVTAAAGAWTLGTLVEIIPASTVTEDFDIHSVDVEDISANGIYELVLYYGAGDTEAGRIRIVQGSVTSAVLNTPIQTPIIPANSRVRAAVASAAGSQSVTISLRYHTY
jgi:hypothetical protein